MRLTHEQINIAADFIQGSCIYTIEDGLEEALGYHPDDYMDVMDDDDMRIFDDLVFHCNGCGWWCGTDELSENEYDQICVQCYEEDNEDED